jgi:hypothetical protein
MQSYSDQIYRLKVMYYNNWPLHITTDIGLQYNEQTSEQLPHKDTYTIQLKHFGYTYKNKKTNFVGFSPQANYTDWATATCRRNVVPTFADRGVSHGQRSGSPTVNLSFPDQSRYFSFK